MKNLTERQKRELCNVGGFHLGENQTPESLGLTLFAKDHWIDFATDYIYELCEGKLNFVASKHSWADYVAQGAL